MANQNEHPGLTTEYNQWLADVKSGIRQCQIKAAMSVNRDLLQLYWQLGHDIAIQQSEARWGDGLIARLSRDLTAEFPEMRGWSERNLRSIRNWYVSYSQYFEIQKQVVAELEATPIGVSSMRIYDELMKDFKTSLPSVEDIENSLKAYR